MIARCGSQSAKPGHPPPRGTPVLGPGDPRSRAPESDPVMTRFATFGALYMSALFLELAEKWRYPAFTAGILLLGIILVAARPTRLTFALFLILTTAHTVLAQFPDVANHVNVELYASVLLLGGIAYSLAHHDRFPTDDHCFTLVRPVLQCSMILVYVIAGFDKLNSDFLNPRVSCVGTLVSDLTRVAAGHTLGVPTALWFGVGLGVVMLAVVAAAAPGRPIPPLVRAGALGIGVLSAILVMRLAPAIRAGGAGLLIGTMAGVVILWEFVGGLLLAVPSVQGPVLAFSWAMHASLSLIGFIDFGALALALLFTFVPDSYLDLMTGPLRVPFAARSIPRVQAYFAMAVLSGVASGLQRRLVAALLFNLGVLVLIWPMLLALAAPAPRPAWAGVRLKRGLTPVWLFLCPAVLVVHGLTSYLGLRTAGNFSMFSNLRTEGVRSNHLLLARNPLKLWGYQEDVVRFTEIDDRRAAIGYQYQPLEGMWLPVVEFRKLIYEWTRAGKTVPMTFEYRGILHTTPNIVDDPLWRSGRRDWEMRLMDFRAIQPEGPNRCRW